PSVRGPTAAFRSRPTVGATDSTVASARALHAIAPRERRTTDEDANGLAPDPSRITASKRCRFRLAQHTRFFTGVAKAPPCTGFRRLDHRPAHWGESRRCRAQAARRRYGLWHSRSAGE